MLPFELKHLEPDDDAPHLPGSDPWWREAWYFEFYDPRTAVQLQAYQGVFPNQGLGDLVLSLFRDRQPLLQILKTDYTLQTEPIEERLCFGPLRLEMYSPFQRWRMQYDSNEVQADIEFKALHAPFSWAEARLWMETSAAPEQRSQHFDQFGSYGGALWIRGKEIRIDCLGFRDRMWGWGGRRQWRKYVVTWAGFDPDDVVNIALMSFAGEKQGLCGYIHRDGLRSLLRHARFEVQWDPRRWKSISRVHAEAEDLEGRKAQFVGHPLDITDTSHHWKHRKDSMLFSVGQYECGKKKGYGVMNWAFATEAEKPKALEATLDWA